MACEQGYLKWMIQDFMIISSVLETVVSKTENLQLCCLCASLTKTVGCMKILVWRSQTRAHSARLWRCCV